MSTIAHAAATAGQEIQLYGLSKYYGELKALDDASLTIAAGEFLTLLGPSGSGKSTLLMALAGFIEPTHGHILLDGKAIDTLPAEQRNFGVMFQGYALFPHMTVAENVGYPLRIRRLPPAEIKSRVAEMLKLVQLGHLGAQMPTQLSGGQQQRVALARALAFSPRVMLLDEPMGALDKNLRAELQLELRQLHQQLGRTFVNVTHDQEEAMAMSDRIAIMRDGRIIQVGTPRELYDRPRTHFVADFLGKSNMIRGTVASVADGSAHIDTPDGRVVHRTGDRAVDTSQEVLLALRPHQVGPEPDANRRPVEIRSVIFLGTHAEVIARCESGLDIVFDCPSAYADALPAVGERLEIGWATQAGVLVAPD